MMNLLEEAIIYATIMHQGQFRKFGNSPAILYNEPQNSDNKKLASKFDGE